MDVMFFAVMAIVLFAGLALRFAPDSRDTRRAAERFGSWAGLAA